MNWMEEIRVRVTETDRESVLAELVGRKDLAAAFSGGLAEVRVYAHARIGTDLCLQLCWRTSVLPAEGFAPEGSPEGQRLAAGLRAVGLVQHTVWKQEEPK